MADDVKPIVPVRRGRYASVLEMVKDLSDPQHLDAVTETDADGVLRLKPHPDEGGRHVVRFPLADASAPSMPTLPIPAKDAPPGA
jgi:hypothetical protein